ncbi:MAG: CoB--CoM heterodisulfide reductase subunit C [Methanosarcinaceae archaeon]
MSDPDILDDLKKEGLDILKCMQCGVCSGSCPSGRYTSLNVRRLLRRARRDPGVLRDDTLWMCTTCYNCQERCPRGINIVDAILKLRTIAVHEGIMHDSHRKVSMLLIEHGHAVPINEETMAKRQDLGLDSLPPTVHSYPKALEEVQTILRSCGFDELVSED